MYQCEDMAPFFMLCSDENHISREYGLERVNKTEYGIAKLSTGPW